MTNSRRTSRCPV